MAIYILVDYDNIYKELISRGLSALIHKVLININESYLAYVQM